MRLIKRLVSAISEKKSGVMVAPENNAPMTASIPNKQNPNNYEVKSNNYAGRNVHHHHLASAYPNKHDSGMASNEFSTEMRTPEIVVIILILCLWVLSLRKLVKHFDKLRSTQYREIPYKYRLKDPENIANIKIVNNQNESVLYTRDPVKSLRSKSIACGDTYATNGAASISVLGGKKPGDCKKKSVVDSMLFGSALPVDNLLKTPTATVATASSVASSINYKKNLSTSLNSMSNYGAQRQCRNHSIGHMRANMPVNGLSSRASYVSHPTDDSHNKLDPAYLLPVVVRRSLLDLHRKSVENLAAAAVACVPSQESMTMNLLKTPSRDTSLKVTPASSLPVTATNSLKSNCKLNINILRPPKLNLQRKSSNVTSDSTLSVKISESPV